MSHNPNTIESMIEEFAGLHNDGFLRDAADAIPDIFRALHQRIMELEQKVKQAEDKAVFKAIFKPGAQPD